MAKKAPLLFKVIQLPAPPGLVRAIKPKKVFSCSAPSCQIGTDWDAGAKAEFYRLIIISR